MIQIWFRTQVPSIKTGTIRNPRQNLQLIHDPRCFQNPRLRSSNPKKSTIRALLKAKSVDPKTYSAPSERFDISVRRALHIAETLC